MSPSFSCKCEDRNWDRNDPSGVFNRQYRCRALASPGECMGGQEGHGVLGRTVKKVRESRTGVSTSRDNKEGRDRNGSKSIIRLANDLHACTGYKGNRMKRTKDRLANETTGVKRIPAGRRIKTGEVVQGDFVRSANM